MASKGFEEARRKCVQVARDGGDRLRLDGLELTELPKEILECTRLRILELRGNRLTEFPPALCRLTGLELLDLRRNPIKTLPDELAALQELQTLFLAGTRLEALPPVLGALPLLNLAIGGRMLRDLTGVTLLPHLEALDCLDVVQGCALPDFSKMPNLEHLSLSSCKLDEIPGSIFELGSLGSLQLPGNHLQTLPVAIKRLVELHMLDLSLNPIEDLPAELGALPELERFFFDGCPLSRLPPEVVAQGPTALLAYLRDQYHNGTRQWVSKLLVVGQGGVGKTSVLRALRGDSFQPDEATTHGIDVRTMKLPHATEKGVTMDLRAWDFGGQQIYHATHQFFLTKRSLFLLVWNARHGHEQGKLFYWLDTIRARAPESTILIVATHADERSADLPLAQLRQRYPQIIAQYVVSNKTGKGIDDLRAAIAEQASKLPLMGERWPRFWLDAANAIRALEKNHMVPQELRAIMNAHGVAEDSHRILATWLHELGDILFFQDNPELADVVLLDPHWATEAISRVLESNDVIERRGIFTKAEMEKLWSNDIALHMQDHLLRLMEQFDLSYRTLDNREVSIVVERLSHDAPAELQPKFEARLGQREVSMRFQLDATLPAGIPTWFIARTHRFTTRIHFRRGALFADTPAEDHVALVQAYPEGRCIHLSVRGPAPHGFFALLRDGLELTLNRFPGLKVERFIPCPGHEGLPCEHEFKFELLQKMLEKNRVTVECPVAMSGDVGEPNVHIREMLFGLSPSTLDDISKKLDTLSTKAEEHISLIRGLTGILQLEFVRLFSTMQRHEESHCPSLFVLRPGDGKAWKKKLLGETVEMHLVCEAPGESHLSHESGRYTFELQPQWLVMMAPYVEKMVSILKYAAPLLGAAAGYAPEQYAKMFGADLKMMDELIKKLPVVIDDEPEANLPLGLRALPGFERVEGASLRLLRGLLDELDPKHAWGGLRKVLTPEGHYLWLCEKHAAGYRV